jgi:hypothetical protein
MRNYLRRYVLDAKTTLVRYHRTYMPTINRSILEAALEGLETQRAKIDEHIASIRSSQ